MPLDGVQTPRTSANNRAFPAFLDSSPPLQLHAMATTTTASLDGTHPRYKRIIVAIALTAVESEVSVTVLIWQRSGRRLQGGTAMWDALSGLRAYERI